MSDICSMGELLIDFTPAGMSPAGNALFERNPGGGPANLAVGAAVLGLEVSFLGKVGQDNFGRFLADTLRAKNVDIDGLVFDKDVNTTLAFVHLDARGDRSFSFYRKPGADIMYSERDINYKKIDRCAIFHFSSVSMTSMPSAGATRAAVRYAAERGKLISFDPNFRRPLWNSAEEGAAVIDEMSAYADILKISREELELIRPGVPMEDAAKGFLNGRAKIVFVTLGPEGCYFCCKNGSGHRKTYDTDVVDTTGCGDAFAAAALYKLTRCSSLPGELTAEEASEITDFANAAGACAARKRGAIPAMPTRSDIDLCRKNVPLL